MGDGCTGPTLLVHRPIQEDGDDDGVREEEREEGRGGGEREEEEEEEEGRSQVRPSFLGNKRMC